MLMGGAIFFEIGFDEETLFDDDFLACVETVEVFFSVSSVTFAHLDRPRRLIALRAKMTVSPSYSGLR